MRNVLIFWWKLIILGDADGANIVTGGGAPWNAHIYMQIPQYTMTMNNIILFLFYMVIIREVNNNERAR